MVSVTQTQSTRAPSYCLGNGPQVVDAVAVCAATFMLLVDITIVNVALPTSRRPRRRLSDLQWVIDAYALTLAAVLLTGGSLADRSGAASSS